MLLEDHEVLLLFKYVFYKFLGFILEVWFCRQVSRIE